jgi:hypothetical protein
MATKVHTTEEAWDRRTLGAEGAHARLAADISEQAIDDALDLQPISIRLHKRLIEDFKLIAAYHGGIGYQTLMRQVLGRFADCELKQLAREAAAAPRKGVKPKKPKSAA